MKKMKAVVDNVNGRIGIPILMYILGVPGFVVILAWAFFFRNR